jgi:hypothetical protein
MEQKDIDRLLICRAAVDKHREFNKARVEAVTTCKSVTEAKTLIKSKTGVAMTISADTALKSPDAIKSTLEAERTKMTLAMYDVIKGQGFESYGAFSEWYKKTIFDLYKECRPIRGSCDLCGEKEFIDQPCVKALGLCIAQSMEVNDNVYADAFKQECSGTIDKTDPKIYYGRCPKGHGFYSVVAEHKELPVGIDFQWRA